MEDISPYDISFDNLHTFWLRMVIGWFKAIGALIVIGGFVFAIVIFNGSDTGPYAHYNTIIGVAVIFAGVTLGGPYLAFAQLLQLFLSMEQELRRIEANTRQVQQIEKNTHATGLLLNRLLKGEREVVG